jgi:hypothetical protein
MRSRNDSPEGCSTSGIFASSSGSLRVAREVGEQPCCSATLGASTLAIISVISAPRFPLPRIRATIRSTTEGQRFASCIAGFGRLWHWMQ